jgi:hypothetical protein
VDQKRLQVRDWKSLHEQKTEDLKRRVAEGSLSPKKEARAEAVLRHAAPSASAIGWVATLGWELWSPPRMLQNGGDLRGVLSEIIAAGVTPPIPAALGVLD